MITKRVILFVLFLVFISPSVVLAQGSPPRFERITLEQGLSQVTIYCIFQDSRGLMWFGTEDGLNKYDGYTFTVYQRDSEDLTSLSASTILAIDEDASGALWIGTDSGGLNRFDRATEKFDQFRHTSDDPNSLSDGAVTAVYVDASNTLWVGTDSGGLDHIDPTTGHFIHYRHDPNNPLSLSSNAITAIVEDFDGRLWIGTPDGGLNVLDRATGKFTHYRNDPTDPNSLSNDGVTALFLKQDGRLWVGTSGGLNLYAPETGQFTHYLFDPDDTSSLNSDIVRAIYEDTSGTLWVGTASGLNELALNENEEMDNERQGFVRFYNDQSDPGSLSENNVTAICADSSGILWIGTVTGGLNKLDPKSRRFSHFRNDPNNPDSLFSNNVWAILEDKSGTLWIGSPDLNRLDSQTGRFIHYSQDPKDPYNVPVRAIFSIYEDSAGMLWFGSFGEGLSQLDRQTDRFVNYRYVSDDLDNTEHNSIWTIFEDSTGILWLGTAAGLKSFDRETKQFTSSYQHDPANPASLGGDFIMMLFEDRSGVLWVGTNQGLDRFDRQTQTFAHYQNDPANPRSLSSNAVPAIYEDSSGALWIGTDDGLNRFDRATDTFTHYTVKDGLPSNAIGCILEDDAGRLWLSTGKGLSRFDPRTEQFKNYNVRDGLQSDEFNRGACYENRQGEMFFGGPSGLNTFNPVNITDNPHAPPVIITEFLLFNQPVAIGGDSPLQQAIGETEAITLPYWDYVFAFEFAALDYTIPSKNQYAYQLEGYDQGWNYVDSSRRFASYANLPAGAYTFRVKASNNDGVWNEDGAAVKVTIAPPPWKTWWAFTLYGILGVLVVAGYLRYRTRQLERKYLIRTVWAVQQERDRIAALLESRRQFLASISHDLRTPVAIVRGYLDAVISDNEQQPLFVQKLTVMSQELDRLQALLEDLFTLSRLEVDRLTLILASLDVVSVAQRAVAAIAALAWQQGKVEVTLETSQPELWIVADEQRLLQSLLNLLHNAVRHTLPGGIVVVRVCGQPDSVTIQVQDTGEGISPADLPRIWERFYRGQSQVGGGSGLGLALVKEMTEAMGGTVAVESAPGEGSCFTMTFPLPK